jgi:NADH-quinone oxidoreductase subunit G
MLNLEIDGKAVQVAPGSTVMDAANQVGAYIPHFCYHKKLSIAANCRMCLVQVEKAPKPMPACATPVTEGMKVFTASDYAKKAQQSVMEFLLINHPLDCPICDQGGECQLQDLAVGYGNSGSRYQEEKRVVFVKNIGPLVSAAEMSRCIQCTRCVRFGQEVAGIMELGMGGRGEHSEILSFVGKSVDSELSGNMIDVCPVGALTSKPFRYAARTWELQRRKTVSPHDGLNANLQVQVKGDRVMRVLPRENEAINECWISDRDRFSYEGLYSEDRLTSPMVKTDGVWHQASWQDALTAAASAISSTVKAQGGNALSVLMGPHSTLEESFLAKQIAIAVGSNSIDHRLRVTDPSLDAGGGIPWLGLKVSDFVAVDRFLVVGSSLRQEQPLLASRIRARVKKGAMLSVISSVDDDLLCPVAAKVVVKSSGMRAELAGVVVALAKRLEKTAFAVRNVTPSVEAERIAASLASGKKVAVLLGDLALSGTDASQLEALAASIAELTGGTSGRMMLSSSAVSAYVAGAVPSAGGMSAQEALTSGAGAMLLIGFEPELDSAYGLDSQKALKSTSKVIAMVAHVNQAMREKADVLLPIAPFTETSGTYVSQDGTVQSFTGVVRPLGEARPGWKVLRVLGDLLHANVGAFNSSEDVKAAALAGFDEAKLGAVPAAIAIVTATANSALERVADVPIYHADPLVRRGLALSRSAYGRQAHVRMNAETAKQLNLTDEASVTVTQGAGSAVATLSVDASVPNGAVRVPLATEVSAQLGLAVDPISVVAAV